MFSTISTISEVPDNVDNNGMRTVQLTNKFSHNIAVYYDDGESGYYV